MPFDLCAIGNALVDIIVSTDDAFLRQHDIAKGGMTLVDEKRSSMLYAAAGSAATMTSGGSAANTLAGFASLGGTSAFMGKVGRDPFGDVFTHDLRAQKVHFASPASPDLPTGHCLIFVTPDAQRSMNTFLGAAVEVYAADIDEAIVRDSAITYLEGYLFDKPETKKAFRHAAKIAHGAGRKLALTLSDTFCVLRHRDAFLDLVKNAVDILFANEAEIKALYQTENVADALASARAHTEIAVVTQGAAGAVIAARGETHEVAAHPVASVIDTTGAGDLYAAGFLYGVTQHKSLPEAGRIGAVAAAEVIGHYGPRPQKKLSDLI